MKIVKVVHVEDQVSREKEEVLRRLTQRGDSNTIQKLHEQADRICRGVWRSPTEVGRSIVDLCVQTLSTSEVIPVAGTNVEIIPLDEARRMYPASRNLAVGFFSLHPRDARRLTPLDRYHTTLAWEKDDELIVLLGRMGARTVRITETDTEQGFAAAEGKLRTFTTSVSGQGSVAQLVERGKELVVSFAGNDIAPAKDLLGESLWFSDDGQMHTILSGRRFAQNRMLSYTIRNTYTETYDFDFSLAAKLLLLVKVDLEAEFRSLMRRVRLFHVDFPA